MRAAYREAWDSLNLNPGLSTPYLPILCGIGGLDEALSFRAYQLAGTPSANTHWIQWRIISDLTEVDPNDPFVGDLRGLYLAVQDMDGDWLKEIPAQPAQPDSNEKPAGPEYVRCKPGSDPACKLALRQCLGEELKKIGRAHV